MNDFVGDFLKSMREAGVNPRQRPEITSRQGFERLDCADNRKRRNQNISYFLVQHGDICFGFFEDFNKNIRHGWRSKNFEKLDPLTKASYEQEMEAKRLEMEQQREEEYENAAKKAGVLFHSGEPISKDHHLLTKKGFYLDGVPESVKNEILKLRTCPVNNDILVPLYDQNGKLWTIQKILNVPKIKDDSSITKIFMPGGKASGCFYVIGGEFDKVSGKVAIAEGFTTGLTIYMAMNIPVIVTFSSGKLKGICSSKFMVEKKDKVEFIICGDDDKYPNSKGEILNSGRKCAEEARDNLGCRLVFPKFKNEDNKPTDFNDLYILEGIEAVVNQINEVNVPLTPDEEVLNVSKSQLKEKEKTLYVAKMLILNIDTAFNDLSTRKSYLRFKNELNFYQCNTHEFAVKISGTYSKMFNKCTSDQKQISNVIESYLKDPNNNIPWVQANKPVYMDNDKVFFKTDLKGYPLYEIDKNGFRVSSENDYTGVIYNYQDKKPKDVIFRISDERATMEDLELYFSVKGMDLVKIVAFFMMAIFAEDKCILGLWAPKGTGKDYVLSRMRDVMSPLEDFNRVLQDTKKDLIVSSSGTFINSFVNQSGISFDFQDYFCALVGEVSFSGRKLFSDNETSNIKAKTPIIISGVHNVVNREDLLDRMIHIHLENRKISENRVTCKSTKLRLAIQGKVQNYLFWLISEVLKYFEAIEEELTPLDRREKINFWLELCSQYMGLNYSIEDFEADSGEEVLEVISNNPIFAAIEEYLESTNSTILAGSVTEVLRNLKSTSTIRDSKQHGISQRDFMRELGRIDFSKTHINYIKTMNSSNKNNSNSKKVRRIRFEVKENAT